MHEKEITKMDYKELRAKVQELNDTVARMKRSYEDILYNLDYDNFSSTLIKEKDNMKAEIKVTAEEISTKVSRDEFQTHATQTAEAITLQAERIDENDTYYRSQFAITAERIDSSVERITETEESIAAINITADKLESRVQKNITAYFTASEVPTGKFIGGDEDKNSMLCNVEDVYYYYDECTDSWRQYPYGGLVTAFQQTATGFELTGDVKISGDLVAGGTIIGSTINTATDSFGQNVRLNSENSAFEILYNNIVVCTLQASDTGKSGLCPVNDGTLYIGNSIDDGSIEAIGYWNFSCATVEGLSAIAVFG